MIGGRYEQLGELGHGGQGVVERAWDTAQQRMVALKVRAIDATVDREAILEEARLLLRVPPHRNIAMVRADFFEGQSHVLVMDFVAGPNLAELLKQQEAGGLEAEEVVRWLADVASALDHLHRQEPPVIHGDVKPANIVTTSPSGTERAVLVDFGIAAPQGSDKGIGGTASYAAPELASSRAVSPASDIYSLAATSYALLTGNAPLPGASDDLSAAARAAIAHGLAVHPESRPSSASAFVAELADALDVALAAPPARRAPPGRAPRLIAALAAAVIVAGAVAYAVTRPEPRRVTRSASVRTTVQVPTTPAAAVDAGEITGTSTAGKPASGTPVTAAHSGTIAASIGRVGVYRADGTLHVNQVVEPGTFKEQGSGSTSVADGTAIAKVRDGLLFAYRRGDGRNRLITVDPDGALALGPFRPDIGDGWTHVVGLNEGLLFFYRQSDGYSATHRYNERASLVDADSYLESSVNMAGFDRVAHAGATRVLLYASQTGRALLLSFNASGAPTEIARPQLTAGWSVLAPTGQGFVAGVARGGDAEVLRASATGVSPVGRTNVGAGTWREASAFADGTVVHDPATGTGYVVRMTSAGAAATRAAVTTPTGARIAPID